MDEPVTGAAGTDEAEVKPVKYKPFYLKTKTEDMIKYGKKAVAMFPRRERQTADAIRETMLEMYRLTIMIERKYYKKTTLQELDTEHMMQEAALMCREILGAGGDGYDVR